MQQILAKSKIDSEHVEVKKNIGCDGIEYQMLASDFDEMQELASPDECLAVITEHPARAIHLPMSNCNIEDDVMRLLDCASFLAERSYEIWSKQGVCDEPIIVTHNETHYRMLGEQRLREMTAMMQEMLMKYPHVQYVIENTTPFRWLQKGDTRLSSGYYDSPVMIADYLQEMLKTNRIGTCMDSCHAGITIEHMNRVCDACDAVDMKFTMGKFFALYRPTCKLFHFASYDDGGYGAGHATPFTKDKMGELREQVELYELYGYDCPVTLEINEKDLLVCDGYRVSKENLDMVLWECAEQ